MIREMKQMVKHLEQDLSKKKRAEHFMLKEQDLISRNSQNGDIFSSQSKLGVKKAK
jgi:hypothetical protein